MVTDIKKSAVSDIEAEARKEIAEEHSKKAKEALKSKFRELASAEQVVRNVNRQIEDLKEQIEEGTL